MARVKTKGLTDVERKIMNVLWARGPSTVREIADELSKEKATAYTSVQTMCGILADKGYASFSKECRAFIYEAKVAQDTVRRSALKSMLDQFFGGSPQALAQHLVKESDIDLEDIRELQEMLDESKPKDERP